MEVEDETLQNKTKMIRRGLHDTTRRTNGLVSRSVVDYLSERGLIHSMTHESLGSLEPVDERGNRRGVYLGIDPTANGLHVGHLCGVLALRAFQRAGFQPIALVGGATGLIGDPSGRATERQLLSLENVADNVKGIQNDLNGLLDSDVKLVNNLDWYGNMSIVTFLRDVGKNFRLGPMLSKESVKSRMQDNVGMSFTEFSYQTLQGYDFLHLKRTENCVVQIGGSDQWGNIVAGVDLIGKADRFARAGEDEERKPVYGLTIPLLTTSTGEKFGKSAGNAVWLNRNLTSDFEFYQYFLRTQDEDVEKLLYSLTEAKLEDLKEVMHEQCKAPESRVAQKFLAEQVTEMVRGKETVVRAQDASKILFGMPLNGISKEDLYNLAVSGNIPIIKLRKRDLEEERLAAFIERAGMAESKSAAKRLVLNGGFYINNSKIVTNASMKFDPLAHAVDGELILLRAGKFNYKIVQLV